MFLLLMISMIMMESQVRQSHHNLSHGKLYKKRRLTKRLTKKLQFIMHTLHMESKIKNLLTFMMHTI